MITKNHWFYRLYHKIIIKHPLATILFVIGLTLLAASQLYKFRLDASGESLVLENDASLAYYRESSKKYGSDDFLVVTWQPHNGLVAPEALEKLKSLTNELSAIETVSSVNSILNVPLLDGLKLDADSLSQIKTLNDLNFNDSAKTQQALDEFIKSPIYKNLLVSSDGKTSAIQINFERDTRYFSLQEARDQLRMKKSQGKLTTEDTKQLSLLETHFDNYSRVTAERSNLIVTQVREIISRYKDDAKLHLGGVSMITNDMLAFIQHDITVFGIGIVLFIMLALFVFFGKLRWVLLPLFSCLVTVVILAGLLSFFDWRITVISSNFPSILLIVVLALSVHLIVFYRDYISRHPNIPQAERVATTVKRMFWPCFYTALTTIVAFVSLLISGIRPVIDFGWIMTLGILLGFILTFLIFPSFIQLLKPDTHTSGKSITYRMTDAIYNFSVSFKGIIFIVAACLVAFSAYGISQLKVENSFIDYFKENTEIHQGMKVIDQQLGGTTPLDIIIKHQATAENSALDDEFADEFEDEFDDDFDNEFSASYDAGYWFQVNQLEQLEKIHNFIDNIEVTGKVQSLATTGQVIKALNGGNYPDQLTLTILHQKLPDSVREPLLHPYLSEDGNETRINIRVEETNPKLKRAELISTIRNHLIEDAKLKPEDVKITGMLVLYNNMLESLFDSQIMTIGTVYLAILVMFLILFRSLILAIIATIPNALSAAMVLGIMGWVGIPMDMMTITIAAIVIGIAVDNSIHYVHRFKTEFQRDNDYLATMKRCHTSIGKAIYYTGLTVIVGFAILALSDFIPSIYFGLLTGLAMAVALFLNLTLLPLMIITFKPIKK